VELSEVTPYIEPDALVYIESSPTSSLSCPKFFTLLLSLLLWSLRLSCLAALFRLDSRWLCHKEA